MDNSKVEKTIKTMDYQKLQLQYNKIFSYFKTTCEPFDFLEWNGEILKVWNKNEIIEKYSVKDLIGLKILEKL